MWLTLSCAAISGIAVFVPLNENEDVRDATLNVVTRVSTLSSSSEIPWLKYSLLASSLRLAKGSTAMDISRATASSTGGGLGSITACFGSASNTNLSTAK